MVYGIGCTTMLAIVAGYFMRYGAFFWPDDIIHVMGDRIHNMIVFGVAEMRQAPQKLPSSYLSVRNVIIIIIIIIIKWTFRGIRQRHIR